MAAATIEPLSAPADKLTAQERLILSQAVYKFGAAAWPVISKALLEHPICQGRPTEYFEPEGCEASYIALMKSIGQNVPAPDGIKPQAKPHLRLAQTFYLARLEELKRSIEAHEASFVTLMNDINSIKSGQLDATIRDELRAVLARKYGKKRLDSWVPPVEEVKAAVEAGPPTEAEEVVVPVEVAKEGAETAVADSGDTAQASPAVKEQPTIDELVPAPTIEVDEVVITPKPDVETPVSELSPPPSVPPTAPALHIEPTADDVVSPGPTDEPSPSTRPSKRKASAQPRNPPPSKRSTRRAVSPEATASEPASEGLNTEAPPEPEVVEVEEEEDEELLSAKDKRSTRRMSKRSHGTRDSPKASSPASRRAASVVSNASTPAPEEKRSSRRPAGKRGMRDDVVSKSVREQSAAVSVKDEAPEEEKEVSGDKTEKTEQPKEQTEKEEEPKEKKGQAKEKRGQSKRDDEKEKIEQPEEKKDQPEEDAPSTRARRGKPDTSRTKKADTEATEEATTPSASVPPSTSVPPSAPTGPAPITGPRHSRSKENKDGRIMAKSLGLLLDTISSHRDGSVFQNPVRNSDAPDYYRVIKRPMDLKTIRQRVRDGQISSIDEFERDILLIFSNAMMYNAKGSQVYKMAQDMLKESENHIAHYRAMQHDIGR